MKRIWEVQYLKEPARNYQSAPFPEPLVFLQMYSQFLLRSFSQVLSSVCQDSLSKVPPMFLPFPLQSRLFRDFLPVQCKIFIGCQFQFQANAKLLLHATIFNSNRLPMFLNIYLVFRRFTPVSWLSPSFPGVLSRVFSTVSIVDTLDPNRQCGPSQNANPNFLLASSDSKVALLSLDIPSSSIIYGAFHMPTPRNFTTSNSQSIHPEFSS